MGQVCSGSAVGKQVSVERDPEDMELEALEMKPTKIPEFDSTFERASGPLNELVDIHNGLFQSGENLKQAGAALQGATQIRLQVESSQVNLVLWHYDHENELELSQAQVNSLLSQDDRELPEAYGVLLNAIGSLNQALGRVENVMSVFREKHRRLLIEKPGAQDRYILGVNRALFTFRKHLAQHAHVSSIKQAMQLFLREVGAVQDVKKLRIQKSDSGSFQVVEGDRVVDFTQLQSLSKPARDFAVALKELMGSVEEATKSVPELVDASKEFLAEAQQFPANMTSAVSNSSLSLTEIPKASIATSANIKALSNGPRIASATMTMIQIAAKELYEAVSQPVVGA